MRDRLHNRKHSRAGRTARPLPVAPVGSTDKPAPKLPDQVRTAIRTRHDSRRTEEAYVHWAHKIWRIHMKCDACGKDVTSWSAKYGPKDTVFCKECFNTDEVEKISKESQDKYYCSGCGTELLFESMYCSKCASDPPDSVRYCPRCGTQISPDAENCDRCTSALEESTNLDNS